MRAVSFFAYLVTYNQSTFSFDWCGRSSQEKRATLRVWLGRRGHDDAIPSNLLSAETFLPLRSHMKNAQRFIFIIRFFRLYAVYITNARSKKLQALKMKPMFDLDSPRRV